MACKWRWMDHIVPVALLLLLIGACASAPKNEPTVQPRAVSSPAQSDTKLFQEGCALLGASGEPADYNRAKEVFLNLINIHPQSKWRSYAEAYRKLLEERKTASDEAARSRLEAGKAQLELNESKISLDQLKKANRALQEKLQADTARLQQENEQLRGDLQRLKQLEIDLQRRERSLR